MVNDEVSGVLEEALERSPGSVPLRLHLAELCLEAGDAARAVELAAQAVALEPENTTARGLVARATAVLVGVPEPGGTGPEGCGAAGGADDDSDDDPGWDDPDGEAAGGGAPLARVVPLVQASPLHAVPSPNSWDVERPTVTLDDVGGLEDVKQRLRISFLAPLRNPELRRMYGKSLRGGLLMWGPPGCGKTFIARAVAGELGARFLSVGLEDVLGVYHGESELNLHSVFETARRSNPCVLFLDEIDALGHKRSQLRGSAGRNTVVQLLQELDGVADANDGLFVLAATNQPWDVDPALRRPGRFDRMLLVLPPDAPARAAILRYHLRDRPLDDDVDIELLAAGGDGLSGADLALACDAAAETGITRALETGDATPITMADLRRAIREVAPSTRAWLHLAKTYAQFSGEGGSYDDLLAYLRKAGT